MKARDPKIKIAVPVGLSIYSYQSDFDLPVLAGASYDAVVLHNYPMRDPISDGSTLYPDRVAANIGRTQGVLLKLQTELMNNGKSNDAIWITEWNGESFGENGQSRQWGPQLPCSLRRRLASTCKPECRSQHGGHRGLPNGCSTFNYDGGGETSYDWWECGSTALVYRWIYSGCRRSLHRSPARRPYPSCARISNTLAERLCV